MTDERSSGTEFSPIEASVNGSSNGSGSYSAATTAVAASPDVEALESEAPEAEGETAESALESEPAAIATLASVDESEVPEAPVAASEAPVEAEAPGLVAEFARAMHAAAAAERARISQDIDRRREAHLATVQTRRESEATRMRELADEDRASIESWVTSEQERIKTERERRITVLEEDLKTSLAEHTATFEREVEAVEAAITSHRGQLDGFFEGLDDETDPVRIAQDASNRPTFPDLDAASAATADATAVATATPDPALIEPVGVMDPEPAERPAGSWIAPGEAEAKGDTGPASPSEADSSEPSGVPAMSIPVGVTSGGPASSTGPSETLLQSTPVSRPMSWLRRDHDQHDR